MESRDGSWKREILSDFARWLDELPDGAEGRPAPAPQRGDMARLFGEFAALRQEVKRQSRAQQKALLNLDAASSAFATVEGALGAQRDAVEKALARHDGLLDAQAVIEAFLEIGDALARSRDEAARLQEPREQGAGPDAAGLVAGLDLIIGKFERILREFGIERIDGVGAAFDPRTMTALGTRDVAGAQDGTVVEVVRGGYVRDGKVIRAAAVFVNRAGNHDLAAKED